EFRRVLFRSEVRDGEKLTSGGSSDSEANDWQVNPVGPAVPIAVMTTTPDAKCPRTSRIRSGDTAAGSSTSAYVPSSMVRTLRGRNIAGLSADRGSVSATRHPPMLTRRIEMRVLRIV